VKTQVAKQTTAEVVSDYVELLGLFGQIVYKLVGVVSLCLVGFLKRKFIFEL
jgi:hypothetical protein